jgi:alpha-1,4-digalacturonate transport system permease protein
MSSRSRFCLVFILPVIYIIFSAFKPSSELFSANPTFIPKDWTLDNFTIALSKGNFSLYIFNTFLVAISSTIIAVIINTMAGYALIQIPLQRRECHHVVDTVHHHVALEVIMVPIFSVLRFFGLYNSLLALIIPPAATPTGIFLMRQYLLTIPDEVIQAARIDGASEWRIFWNIILPNAKPAIATLAIFSFMWRWNDYVWPLIAINSPKKYTLQLAIANFSGEFGIDYNSVIAMSALAMIPMLIVFLIFQRQFVQGTVESGMKG